MKLTFNRSHTVEVKITKPGANRAFVFDLEVAIAKPSEPPVDPMSGMLLNLVDADAMLAELHNTFPSADSFQSLLEKSRDFISAKLKAKGCVLNEICFREKRGFSFGWKAGALFMAHNEVREWAGGVYRFESERAFEESLVENQQLNLAATVVEIFALNPLVQSLVIENLGSGEKSLYFA